MLRCRLHVTGSRSDVYVLQHENLLRALVVIRAISGLQPALNATLLRYKLPDFVARIISLTISFIITIWVVYIVLLKYGFFSKPLVKRLTHPHGAFPNKPPLGRFVRKAPWGWVSPFTRGLEKKPYLRSTIYTTYSNSWLIILEVKFHLNSWLIVHKMKFYWNS